MAANIINILHLADLHLGAESSVKGVKSLAQDKRSNAFRMLIQELQTLDSEWKPNIIVVTGDIGCNGKRDDYTLAKDTLQEIRNTVRVQVENVILCPGNHDVDTDTARSLPDLDDIDVANLHLSKDEPKLLKARCSIFKQYVKFCETFNITPLKNGINNTKHPTAYLYGYQNIFGITFIVLNSAWNHRNRPPKVTNTKNLPVCKEHVIDMQESIMKMPNNINITLFHHPPTDLHRDEQKTDNINGKSVVNLIADFSDIILHGHEHMPIQRSQLENGCHVFRGGAANPNKKGEVSSFQVIQLNKNTRTFSHKIFRFDNIAGNWIQDTKNGLTLKELHVSNGKKDIIITPAPTPRPPIMYVTMGKEEQVIKDKSVTKRDEVYISCEQDVKTDKQYFNELYTFLQPLHFDHDIKIWHKGLINSGENTQKIIQEHRASARVAILMVSPEYLASESIRNEELPELLQAAINDNALIIPVPIRQAQIEYTKIKGRDGQKIRLANYQPVCDPKKPLQAMNKNERDKIYSKICEDIKRHFESDSYTQTQKEYSNDSKPTSDTQLINSAEASVDSTQANDTFRSDERTNVVEKASGIINNVYPNPVYSGTKSNKPTKDTKTNTSSTDSTLKDPPRDNHTMSKNENTQDLFTPEIQNFVLKQLDGIRFNTVKRLQGGLSGSQVFLINITSHNEHLNGPHIIKLTKSENSLTGTFEEGSQRCQNILTHCNNEFRGHLVNSDIYYHENVQIIRSDYALPSLMHSENLCNIPLDKRSKYAEKISYDLLAKWNKNCTDNADLASFFSTLLCDYKKDDSEFNKLCKLLLVNPERKTVLFPFSTWVYPNPYYYITHIDELINLIHERFGQVNMTSGKTHGDLHSQNIICDSREDAFDYKLIDYTCYDSDSFVLYDHAKLEVVNYWHNLKNETIEDWKYQLTLIEKNFDITVETNKNVYHGHTPFIYKSELLDFRNAVCKGITDWQKNKYPRDIDKITIQLACARIAAGIEVFSFLSKIKQKTEKKDAVTTTKVETPCSSPFENFEECVQLFYYTTICLNDLIRNIVKTWKWNGGLPALLKGAYPELYPGSKSWKLIWDCKGSMCSAHTSEHT